MVQSSASGTYGEGVATLTATRPGSDWLLAASPASVREGGAVLELFESARAPYVLGRKATRRQTLQAVTASASGLTPGSVAPLDPCPRESQTLDPIATAAARLRSAVRSDDVPLPIVCLPDDEWAPDTPS